MVNALGLVHGACAAIVACIAIGIYQRKPQPARIEQRLAHLPLSVQAVILSLLVVLIASEMEWVSGDLTLGLPISLDTIGLIIHEAGHFFNSWAGPIRALYGRHLVRTRYTRRTGDLVHPVRPQSTWRHGAVMAV